MNDAGLISSSTWYDSFLNTVENRVCEVVYDGSKTYGKTYYWFQFTTAGLFASTAYGWNATTHVPTGTQYLDYFATTTNVTTNHRTLVTLTNTTSVTFTAYKSGTQNCIVIRNGATTLTLSIIPGGVVMQPWVDLNRVGIMGMQTSYSSNISSQARFIGQTVQGIVPRRTAIYGVHSIGSTTIGDFVVSGSEPNVGYKILGLNSGSGIGNNGVGASNVAGMVLPVENTTANPAFSSTKYPIVHTNPYALNWTSSFGTSDFGYCGDYTNRTYAIQDTMVVTSGSEEWEVLHFNNGAATATPTALFLARTI
jgi:hypothetical protein